MSAFPGKKTLLSRMALAMLFVQVLSALMTYPLQVLTVNKDVSLTKILFAGMLGAFATYLMANIGRIKVEIPRGRLASLLVLGILNIGALTSVVINYGDALDLGLVATYGSYSVWLTCLWIARDQLELRLPSPVLEWLLFLVSVCNFAAVAAQSLLWRVPPSEIIQEGKAFVGPFMRAGLIYTDCNFLGINLAILFFLNILIVRRFPALMRIANVLLVLGIFLTFSRGNIVFFTAIFLAYRMRDYGSVRIAMNTVLAVTALAVLVAVLHSNFPFLFERFHSEEGVSSAEARIRQYHALAAYIVEQPMSLILGNGPRATTFVFEEDIHNFFLGIFADFGIVGLTCVAALIYVFFVSSASTVARYLIAFWVLESATLPNFPGNLFLIFAIAMLKVSHDVQPAGREGLFANPVPDPQIAVPA